MASVEFSQVEAEFAISMANVVKNRITELKAVSHSGVDQLLFDSQIMEIDKFIEKMSVCVPEPEPFVMVPSPEA